MPPCPQVQAHGCCGAGAGLGGRAARKKRRQIDGEAGFPVGAAVGVILRRQPVEGASDFTELPLDVDLTGVEVLAFEADRFAPPHAGVGDREDHGEVVVAAGQQRGPLGGEQDLQRGGPGPLLTAVEPAAGLRGRGCGAGGRGCRGSAVACAPRRRPGSCTAGRGRRGPSAGRSLPGWAGRSPSSAMSAVLSEFKRVLPHAGRMNRRIRYSRLSWVLMPTSCRGSQRSIHSSTVVSPAFRSVQRPSRIFDSWSRPQTRAAALVSKPDWLASCPLGSLYFTRHGRAPFPRFSA